MCDNDNTAVVTTNDNSTKFSELVNRFPTDLWVEVFARTYGDDLIELSKVDRLFKSIINENDVWLKAYGRRFGLYKPNSFPAKEKGEEEADIRRKYLEQEITIKSINAECDVVHRDSEN